MPYPLHLPFRFHSHSVSWYAVDRTAFLVYNNITIYFRISTSLSPKIITISQGHDKMPNDYLNSVNLNSESNFPYLCMDIEKGKSIPEPPGFYLMHWHEDFQFIYVYTGKLFLHTLDQTRIINENSGVFINKNIVHLVLASEDCHYKSFLFPKQLVSFYTGGPALRYVDIVSECEQISCLLLEKSVSWQKDILDLLVKLSGLESQRTEFYEYEILVFLSQLWLILIKNIKTPHTIVTDDVKKRMQLFLKYIELHYAEELSLDELARCAGVSKSECLRCLLYTSFSIFVRSDAKRPVHRPS